MREVNQYQTADLYREAFKQVCEEDDWKKPIDCMVPYHLANLYMQAIEFVTGVPAQGTAAGCVPGMYRLTCIGYRAGPCN